MREPPRRQGAPRSAEWNTREGGSAAPHRLVPVADVASLADPNERIAEIDAAEDEWILHGLLASVGFDHRSEVNEPAPSAKASDAGCPVTEGRPLQTTRGGWPSPAARGPGATAARSSSLRSPCPARLPSGGAGARASGSGDGKAPVLASGARGRVADLREASVLASVQSRWTIRPKLL